MGGQACVLYGGAEFSRDADIAILADAENLKRLRRALDELDAESIAVPPLDQEHLDRGLAIHFRCRHPEARGVRVDIMSRMRGVDDFSALWERRTTVHVGRDAIDLLSLPDLVKAKKTQRDKDWVMIARVLEANYFTNRDRPTEAQVEFWLRELRTPSLLVETARRFPDACDRIAADRPLLELAAAGTEAELRAAIKLEEQAERDADVEYWTPLKEELGRLRASRKS